MIHSARFTKGWPIEKLAAFKDKRAFRFKPGATIIFGPNGCGKTTLLRLLGAQSACPEHGGWSGQPESHYVTRPKGKSSFDSVPKFPAALTGLAKLGEGVEGRVSWDGSPTFMHLAHESDKPLLAFGMPHDVLDDSMQISLMMGKVSAGQNRLVRLNKVLEKLGTEKPDLTKLKAKYASDLVTPAFVEFVKKLPRKGPVTALLDEPDRSLDAMNQIMFWARLLPGMAQKLQVIITSHNPLALFVPNAQIIDMEDGYAKKTRVMVGGLIDVWREPEKPEKKDSGEKK